jgi:hypothetical protein
LLQRRKFPCLHGLGKFVAFDTIFIRADNVPQKVMPGFITARRVM